MQLAAALKEHGYSRMDIEELLPSQKPGGPQPKIAQGDAPDDEGMVLIGPPDKQPEEEESREGVAKAFVIGIVIAAVLIILAAMYLPTPFSRWMADDAQVNGSGDQDLPLENDSLRTSSLVFMLTLRVRRRWSIERFRTG